ncbi:MAG: DsrE family protein [Burkholderiaceae bacterium]|nr:DsrE family protein [Burkholderiaceae bacterium]
MIKHRLLIAIAATLFSCGAFAQTPLAQTAPAQTTSAQTSAAADKVVYHLGEGLTQASSGLRNIRNHLEVDPKAKIVVVAHAQGVDFLMAGAQDANKNPFNVIVEDLKSQGVTFEVCQITLRNRKLEQKQFIPEVAFTPSGVVRIAQLQSREGYAYLKP